MIDPSLAPLLHPPTARQPENVLLDARGNVKLTGFALAGLFDPSLGDDHVENLLHATCGTPDYTAPEVLDPTNFLLFTRLWKKVDACSAAVAPLQK